MKTIKSSFWAMLLVVLATACGGNATESKTEVAEVKEEKEAKLSGSVDLNSSQVSWKGTMVGMYEHVGVVKLKTADLTIDNGSITGGNFVVDMSSIAVTEDMDDEKKGKLTGHLSSPDFFDVANSPEAKFEITSVSGNTVSGNLTVRGKTNAETIELGEISNDNGSWKIPGTLKFDRQKYDVAFVHPVQEKVVSDEIEIAIELAVK